MLNSDSQTYVNYEIVALIFDTLTNIVHDFGNNKLN